MNGQICGYNNKAVNASWLDLSDRPFLYFGNLRNLSQFQVCVQSCPNATVVLSVQNTMCKYGVVPKDATDLLALVQLGQCMPYVYNSTDVGGRCVPGRGVAESLMTIVGEQNPEQVAKVNDVLGAQSTSYIQAVSSLLNAWSLFAGGAGATVLVTFLFLVLVKYFAKAYIFLTLFLLHAVLDAIAVFILVDWRYQGEYTAKYIPNTEVTDEWRESTSFQLGLGIFFASLAVLSHLITCVMCSRIKQAVGILREASDAVRAMPLILFYPLTTVVLYVVLFVYGLAVWVYLASLQSAQNYSVQFGDQSFMASATHLQYFHLFGFLWGAAFLAAFNQTVIAGAISTYYWSRYVCLCAFH
jgi:hypothetical protein